MTSQELLASVDARLAVTVYGYDGATELAWINDPYSDVPKAIEFVDRVSYYKVCAMLVKAMEAHQKNADEDFRGNRTTESVRSFKCLEELALIANTTHRGRR